MGFSPPQHCPPFSSAHHQKSPPGGVNIGFMRRMVFSHHNIASHLHIIRKVRQAA
ncbi:hypothetical protein HMPREF9080_02798 [Cardiobacterium valvarum F0432]|uniref:Uncharacterized protein n=1 Tax=Cardiobacterium valvarum F0432 TaxID=797473 RepID=G9ZJ29_9GAMM|nr:hypothetical protein HMPREF9080_02798 [Cardiobacterium valvarum F0432]